MQDDIETLIARVNAAEPGARDRLFELLYPELRQLARARLRHGGRDLMLDTSALVHEAYLRFIDAGALRGEGRRAFFAYASQVMRSVIVDAARELNAQRRGGDVRHLTLDTRLIDELPGQESDLLHVDEALRLLAEAEPRLAQVVEMRYFGGYSEAEIGEALEVTGRTVRRDWDKARLLLSAILGG